MERIKTLLISKSEADALVTYRFAIMNLNKPKTMKPKTRRELAEDCKRYKRVCEAAVREKDRLQGQNDMAKIMVDDLLGIRKKEETLANELIIHFYNRLRDVCTVREYREIAKKTAPIGVDSINQLKTLLHDTLAVMETRKLNE